MLVIQTARFRSMLMKIDFIYSLNGNILTLVPSFWINNHLLQTVAQKQLSVTDLKYLPTQLTAEIVRVGLVNPPHLSAIHGASIQSIPRWECKPRTEALALECRLHHTTAQLWQWAAPKRGNVCFSLGGQTALTSCVIMTGTVCWPRKFNLPQITKWFCRSCFNVHGCQFRKSSMEGQLGLTSSESDLNLNPKYWCYLASLHNIWDGWLNNRQFYFSAYE